jgi:hypothetical protein
MTASVFHELRAATERVRTLVSKAALVNVFPGKRQIGLGETRQIWSGYSLLGLTQ